jgi:hypothetical protein
VVLDQVTVPAVIALRSPCEAQRVSGYMFTGRGGRPSRPGNVTSRFNQLAVAAGVPAIGRRQVRHLLASSLLDIGYGIREVPERLGRDPAMLMRYYSRVSAVRRRQAAGHIVDLVAPSEAAAHLDKVSAPPGLRAGQHSRLRTPLAVRTCWDRRCDASRFRICR